MTIASRGTRDGRDDRRAELAISLLLVKRTCRASTVFGRGRRFARFVRSVPPPESSEETTAGWAPPPSLSSRQRQTVRDAGGVTRTRRGEAGEPRRPGGRTSPRATSADADSRARARGDDAPRRPIHRPGRLDAHARSRIPRSDGEGSRLVHPRGAAAPQPRRSLASRVRAPLARARRRGRPLRARVARLRSFLVVRATRARLRRPRRPLALPRRRRLRARPRGGRRLRPTTRPRAAPRAPRRRVPLRARARRARSLARAPRRPRRRRRAHRRRRRPHVLPVHPLRRPTRAGAPARRPSPAPAPARRPAPGRGEAPVPLPGSRRRRQARDGPREDSMHVPRGGGRRRHAREERPRARRGRRGGRRVQPRSTRSRLAPRRFLRLQSHRHGTRTGARVVRHAPRRERERETTKKYPATTPTRLETATLRGRRARSPPPPRGDPT